MIAWELWPGEWGVSYHVLSVRSSRAEKWCVRTGLFTIDLNARTQSYTFVFYLFHMCRKDTSWLKSLRFLSFVHIYDLLGYKKEIWAGCLFSWSTQSANQPFTAFHTPVDASERNWGSCLAQLCLACRLEQNLQALSHKCAPWMNKCLPPNLLGQVLVTVNQWLRDVCTLLPHVIKQWQLLI